jgi:uncharacterized protein (DUF2336 family)
MVIRHFLKWVNHARVAERAAAANALARAYLDRELDFEDRCEAEAALTLLLDDPSEKVRLAMAEPFSLSAHAPVQIIAALAQDQKEVAALVLVRSPLLTDMDLIDRVAAGDCEIQRFVAMRGQVSMAVSAAIAEVGEAEACLELLENAGAQIAALSFRRIVERHGHVANLREALIADARLPSDCRHMLLVKLGEALKSAPLVMALMGERRAERIMQAACLKASVTLIESTPQTEYMALVEHLRLRGDLTAGFMIRTVANGKIDFFGTALVALSERDERRVGSLLAAGRDVAISALLRAAGLADATHGVILCALKIWREVANGRRVAGAQEVTWLMLKEIGATPGQAGPDACHVDLAKLLKSIHIDALRDNARSHALAIAAA